jgi:hypothetical protein
MSLEYAYFKNLETGKELKVQFNPAELSFNKTAQFAEIAIPGLDSPLLQYIRGGNETLTLELFFDATDERIGNFALSVTSDLPRTGSADVSAGTDRFYNLVKQDPNTHAPPRCRFSWGNYIGFSAKFADLLGEASQAPFWFTGVVESIDRKFLLFSPEGVPLRARLAVKMREYKTISEMVAKLQSADHTKARVLKRRERLDQISANEYGTPAEWRRIAEENDIDDPRRVPPGTMLKIPAMRIESAIRSSR